MTFGSEKLVIWRNNDERSVRRWNYYWVDVHATFTA